MYMYSLMYSFYKEYYVRVTPCINTRSHLNVVYRYKNYSVNRRSHLNVVQIYICNRYKAYSAYRRSP